MFRFFKKSRGSFSLETFQAHRKAVPDDDYIMGLIVVDPIMQIASFAAEQFWEEGRLVNTYEEALNLALHMTSESAARNNVSAFKQRASQNRGKPSLVLASNFMGEIWSESASYPSISTGGKADFSSLEDAKSNYFRQLEEEFVSLAKSLQTLRDQSHAH